MPNHPTPAHRPRRTALVAVAAALLGAIGTAVATVPAAPPAAAAGPPSTYSGTTIQPGTLPGAFSAPAGSDGWSLALSTTQVFNITHHVPTLEVTCHNQSDGSLCWPQSPMKVVTSGSFSYSTPVGAGDYLDQASGHLYTFAVQTNGNPAQNRAGVVCIDTTKDPSASGPSLFCGFTPLSRAGDAPIAGGTGSYAGLTAPVQVGTDWYSFNEVAGAGPAGGLGTENTLMCFSLATFSACPTPNITVPLTGTVQGIFGTAPPIGASGTDVFVPVAGSGPTAQLGCYDTATGAGCTGAWPVTLPALAGSPFALLDAGGTPQGVCVPVAGDPCLDFTGAPVATPPGMASVIGENREANGPAVTLGASVYVADQASDTVECYDSATSGSCANYPKAFAGLSALYTVNRDPVRPNCLWVNSGGGGDSIQDFDATTTGRCAGPIRVQSGSVIDGSPTCQPQPGQGVMYQSLQVTSPARGTYASGTVQVADPQGTPTAVPPLALDGFGTADLSGIDFSSDPLPQFVVTLYGQTQTPATVSLRLIWKAAYARSCISGGQSVSSVPGYWMVATDGGVFNYGNAGFYGSTGNLALSKPIVGMAIRPTRDGYWLVAGDGGIFNYGNAGFYGSTGSISLNRPIVGMAATPDGGGYWLVAADGGVFAFGDAGFYGSTGGIRLNRPIVGMAADPMGGGYWMVASDGGIFAFGAAGFYGSAGSLTLNQPVVGMAPTFDGTGYWLVAADGGIFNYGSAVFGGSAGNLRLNRPIRGMAA